MAASHHDATLNNGATPYTRSVDSTRFEGYAARGRCNFHGSYRWFVGVRAPACNGWICQPALLWLGMVGLVMFVAAGFVGAMHPTLHPIEQRVGDGPIRAAARRG